MTQEDKQNKTLRDGGRPRWFTVLLVVACAGLGAEVVLLARKNQELRQQIRRLDIQRAATGVEAGETMPPFVLVNEKDGETRVGFGQGQPRSLLLFFAPGCDACEHVYPIWNELVAELPPHWRVLAIRVDEPGDVGGTAGTELNLPSFTLPDNAPDELLKVTSVPTTLVLDSNGRVEKAWTGMLPSATVEELRAMTGVSTP